MLVMLRSIRFSRRQIERGFDERYGFSLFGNLDVRSGGAGIESTRAAKNSRRAVADLRRRISYRKEGHRLACKQANADACYTLLPTSERRSNSMPRFRWQYQERPSDWYRIHHFRQGIS